jgi:hypothetical protein
MTDELDFTALAQIKKYLETRIDELEKRQDGRFQLAQNYVEMANKELDKRLEGMNKFRETINDQAARLATRVEVDSKLGNLQEKIDDLKSINWPLYSIMVVILLATVSAVWVILGLRIEAVNQPALLGLSQLRTEFNARERAYSEQEANIIKLTSQIENLMASYANSRNDREQLNERVRDLEHLESEGRSLRMTFEATTNEKLVVVMDKFREIENLIGLMKESINQYFSLIWPKIFAGSSFPKGDFNPVFHK